MGRSEKRKLNDLVGVRLDTVSYVDGLHLADSYGVTLAELLRQLLLRKLRDERTAHERTRRTAEATRLEIARAITAERDEAIIRGASEGYLNGLDMAAHLAETFELPERCEPT